MDIMPMSIHKLGNSSVATVPTLYDLIAKGQMPEHKFEKGDIILFASVGAGMNINAVTYRIWYQPVENKKAREDENTGITQFNNQNSYVINISNIVPKYAHMA